MPIYGSASRHASSKSPNSRPAEVRNAVHIICYNCQGVGRSDEESFFA